MENLKKFGIMYYNMINSLIQFALAPANVAVTNLVAPFKNGMMLLSENFIAITNLRSLASEVITNFAAQKRSLRKLLSQTAYTIMKSAYSFGINTENQQVISAMKVTKRQMAKLKGAQFINFMQAAITAVEGIISSLQPYNVTPADVQAWKDLLQRYQIILAAPKNAITKRKGLNQQADELLAQSVELIQNVIDPLSFNYQKLNNAYFLEYRNNRRLYGSNRHTKYIVTAVDDSGNPVFGVKVLQNETTNSTNTDINGQAIVYVKVHEAKGAQPVYRFTITSGTQVIQSRPTEIKKGHTVSRTYEVQPSNFIIPQPVNNNTVVS